MVHSLRKYVSPWPTRAVDRLEIGPSKQRRCTLPKFIRGASYYYHYPRGQELTRLFYTGAISDREIGRSLEWQRAEISVESRLLSGNFFFPPSPFLFCPLKRVLFSDWPVVNALNYAVNVRFLPQAAFGISKPDRPFIETPGNFCR